MGSCSPSLWHRFQRYTLSGERVDFVRWLPPGSRLPFTQGCTLWGPESCTKKRRAPPRTSKSNKIACREIALSLSVSPARLGRVRVRRAHTLDLRSSRHCDLCKAYGALYSIIKYRAVCTALYGSFVKYCLYILNPEFNYNRKGSCGM